MFIQQEMTKTNTTLVTRRQRLVNHLVQVIITIFSNIFFNLFFKVIVEDEEHVRKQKYGPFIYASNHVSELDSLLLRAVLPIFNKKSTLFTVCRKNKEYDWQGWRKFVYGDWIFRMIGAYPAIKGTRNYAKSLKTFVDIGKSKQTILIFIGGRQRSAHEAIKNRGGTAYLSWTTGLPVVPVAISGTYKLSYWKIFFGRQKIVVRFGKPVPRDALFKGIEKKSEKFSLASARVTEEIHSMMQKNALLTQEVKLVVEKNKLQPVSNI